MENLETIIELLYKRTPIQRVIKNELKYSDFDQNEFMRMVTAYIFHYSENESRNLLNYFLDIFQESAKKKGREISRELCVFEPLFYYAQEFLLIHDNEILCRYSRLMEWRRITTELSEDLLVAAFFAGELTHADMRIRGFAWKTVIGHNNTQLNAIVRRGISENHSHLNGAAPIFQISWLSLMNNVKNSQLGKHLREYDVNRRYTNAAYTSNYEEISFYERYMQAALIRLLLYCKIQRKRLKIGGYNIATSLIRGCVELPMFRCDNSAEKFWLDNDMINKIVNNLYNDPNKSWYTLQEIILCVIESCIDEPDWDKIWESNLILKELLESSTANGLLDRNQIIEIVRSNSNVSLSQLFMKLLLLSSQVSLEDIQKIFTDKRMYENIWEKQTLINVEKLLQYPHELIYEQDYLQSMIDVFRLGDNEQFQGYENLDYALIHLGQEKTDNFIFAGERWLMYTMLRKVYINDSEYSEYFNLFYAYLLIKESVRSELIQSNKNVGFKNFQRYQNRKGDLLADAIYRKEFTRLAVLSSLVSSNIRKIELRIAPENSVEKMRRQIQHLDGIILPNKAWKKNIFYTMHFIKACEELKWDVDYVYCRHYKKRRDIEKRAYALTGLREKFPYVGERILGIDAAANEIGCRPEVFASVYRYLKNHRYRYYTAKGVKKLPQLGATYHVGEDFLDLADGLRAIEEAILFLNLSYGDRLGHALALGIDVKEWYQVKHYRIALPIQDYLDNLVWIFHKIVQYDIRGFENLKEWIREEYTATFGWLYKENMQQGEVDEILREFLRKKKPEYYKSNYKEIDLGIFNYYNSWKLRGDDPKLYESGYFEENYYIQTQEEFRVNFNYLKDIKDRQIPEVALLYYMYHFNRNIRKAGAKTKEIHVSDNYVEAVDAIQKIMQKMIAKRGISIETNPSSNYLIGTFRQYEKHPILQFYNKGLIHEPEKIKACPQLSVSINTDDQGVFSTSLENEYALLACALENVKDECGEIVYNKSDIYEWLDRIRIMGNEQSFAQVFKREEDNIGEQTNGRIFC